MCSSSLDDALACQALLQIKLQALSSGLRCGEKDRHSRFSHPSPVTSCCREGQWRAGSAVNRRGLQALNSSQSAVAPLTQPQQHFLQLSAPTQQMGQGSQPALALTKNCWIAIPSITQPSGGPSSTQHISGHVPTKSFCRNTSVQLETQHLLSIRDLLSPCPTTEAALTLAGLEGRCSFCKGDSWVESRTPGPLVPSPRL